MKTSSSQTSQQSTERQQGFSGRQQDSAERQREGFSGRQQNVPQNQQGGGSGSRQQDIAAGQQQVREEVAHEEIARRAHELWEQDGCPDGRHEEHWMEAEKQLRGSPIGPDARDEARAIKASAERRASGLTRN